MGAYKYIQDTLQEEYATKNPLYKEKVRAWRREGVFVRADKPANISRARRLGYKAKQGYAVIRTRIEKGRRRRVRPKGGRKPRHNYRYVQTQLSHQGLAEQRVNREYKNMEVLNSYWVGEDGNYTYFEVILADPMRKTVTTTSVARKGKAFRGLTSVGKKARGIGRGKQKTH
jgi:large subunit ribosomal protein L15e